MAPSSTLVHRVALVGALAGAFCAGAVTACAPPSPVPSARPVVRGPAAEVAPASERWIVRSTGAARSHELRVEALLISRVDSVERTDTLQSIARTTWTYSAVPSAARVPARIAGTLTAFAASVGERSLETPVGLSLPLTYAAEQSSPAEQPQFTLPRADDCGPSSAAVALVRELWVTPPETLSVGREWTDSAQFMTCRDSIPITVTSTRTFRVLGAERRSEGALVLIERRSSTRMSGSGTQFGEPLEITAEGEGTMLIALAVDGGAIVSGSGEAELRMEMRGRRRTQQLVQRARIVLAAR